MPWSYFIVVVSVILTLVSVIKTGILLLIYKLWMRLGQLFGLLVSPSVLGVVYINYQLDLFINLCNQLATTNCYRVIVLKRIKSN